MMEIICPHCHKETLTYNDNIKGYTCKPCTEKYGVKGKCCEEITKKYKMLMEATVDLFDNRLGHREENPTWYAPRELWRNLAEALAYCRKQEAIKKEFLSEEDK